MALPFVLCTNHKNPRLLYLSMAPSVELSRCKQQNIKDANYKTGDTPRKDVPTVFYL